MLRISELKEDFRETICAYIDVCMPWVLVSGAVNRNDSHVKVGGWFTSFLFLFKFFFSFFDYFFLLFSSFFTLFLHFVRRPGCFSFGEPFAEGHAVAGVSGQWPIGRFRPVGFDLAKRTFDSRCYRRTDEQQPEYGDYSD